MFHYMIDIIAWAVTFSFLAFILAFAAEGRGAHLMRVLLGLAPRKHGIEAFESVPRDDGDWRLLGALEEPQARSPRSAPVATIDRDASRHTGAPA